MTESTPTVSIVIPVYNGQATIGPLVAELESVLSAMFPLDIVLVNDGSADGSLDACLTAQRNARECRVRVLDLSRNFGEHNAVMAGLHRASGEYVVVMDDDFQNPPSEVSTLLAKAREGYDVVYGRYREKRHAWWKNLGSRFANAVATVLLGKPKNLYLSSFKVMSGSTVRQVTRYRGHSPYIDGLILHATRRIGVADVAHADRRSGTSNYTLKKLLSVWLTMSTGFSLLPLRIATVLGILFSLLALGFGISVVLERLQNPGLPVGWASLAFLIVLFSGVQLLVMGIIGEYVGRLFMLNNATEQFIVRSEFPPRE